MTDDDWNDDEDWSDEGDDELDNDPIACPECGARMYGFLDKCPKCGYWLTDVDRSTRQPGMSRPAWQRVTAAIMIAVFLFFLLLAGWTIF